MNEIYRDNTEGAQAKRLELLRRRRDDLALMPHAIRRVAVARAARTAASVTALVLGACMLVTAGWPHLADTIARGLPGPGPAPISSFVFGAIIVGFIVYVAARATHEHRFAVAMSRYVLPGEDLDHDLERLDHERPDDVARDMAHRLEVQSAALPIAAAAVVVPATILYLVKGVRGLGWPATSWYEQALAEHARALSLTAVAGLFGAAVMTRRWARVPSVAPVALLVACLATTGAILAPGSLAWVAGAVAVIAGAAAIVVRRLRIERARIETEDPAAGSDVFTWQGFMRRVRVFATQVRVQLSRRPVRRVIGTLAVVSTVYIGYVAFGAKHKTQPPPPPAAQVAPAVQAAAAPAIDEPRPRTRPAEGTGASTYTELPSAEGHRHFKLHFAEGQPIEIPSLQGLIKLPASWHATITLKVEDESLSLLATPFPAELGTKQRVANHGFVVFDSCEDRPRWLGMYLEPLFTESRDVTISINAKLELAKCLE